MYFDNEKNMSVPDGGFKTPETRLVFEDGKYEVISHRGVIIAKRYGETWRDFTGDKLIGCMVNRIEELEHLLRGGNVFRQ